MMLTPDLQRPPLSRAVAWREVGLAVVVLWSVLGGACFFLGAQSIYDRWGTSLNATLVLDVVFLIGCLAVIGFVFWRQRRQGEGIVELGWGRPVRMPVIVIAVVYGLAWTAMSYMRGGDPLAFPWQRPIMMLSASCWPLPRRSRCAGSSWTGWRAAVPPGSSRSW